MITEVDKNEVITNTIIPEEEFLKYYKIYKLKRLVSIVADIIISKGKKKMIHDNNILEATVKGYIDLSKYFKGKYRNYI